MDYHLTRKSNLISAVSAFSCSKSPLTMTEDRSQRSGFVCKLAICCTVCGKSANIINPYCDHDLEVNGRSVLVAKAIGKGQPGLATFSGLMAPVNPTNSGYYSSSLARQTGKEREASFFRVVAILHEGHLLTSYQM